MTTTKQRPGSDTTLWQRVWRHKLVAGLLTVALGAFVLAWPGPSILVASTLFGAYLLTSGATQVYFAFVLPRSAGSRVLLFISGALSVVLGVLAFRDFGNGYAVLLLALWIGIGFVFQGISTTALGVTETDLPGRGWYIAAGVISVIAGLVMLVWPFDSIVVLTFAAGISLVIMGIVSVVHSLQIRKEAKAVRRTVNAVLQPAAA